MSDATQDCAMEDRCMKLQPDAKVCFVCGLSNPVGLHAQFEPVGPHEIALRLSLDDRFLSAPGIVHGGIIATILDEVMIRAMLFFEPERLMFTGKMEVRYRHTVPLNTQILFQGRITKDRGRMALAEARAILPDGTIAAESSGTLVAVPDEQRENLTVNSVGWRIYDEEPSLD